MRQKFIEMAAAGYGRFVSRNQKRQADTCAGNASGVISPLWGPVRGAVSALAIMPLVLGLPAGAVNAQDAAAPPNNQPANTGASTVYAADFFSQFAPQNAFEMVQRLPGFNFDGGNDARGFGGTAGNVLIDGARPGSKTSLENILLRIPAAQVDRIEVLRGGVGASDAVGQTVVANVVRVPGASTGISLVQLSRTGDGAIRPQTETSYSTTVDGWETSSKLDLAFRRQPRDISFRRFDADGGLTESAEEIRPENFTWAWYNGEASKNLFGGKLVLNTVVGGENFRALQTRDGFDNRLPDLSPGSTPDGRVFIDSARDYREASLGADWTKTTKDQWKIRLLGFTQLSWRDFESEFTGNRPVGNQVFLSDFMNTQDRLESIFRATYGKVGGSKLKPEFGAEVAYNQLKSSFELFEEDENGIVELDVPSANVTVSEIRGEAFTNLVWNTTEKLTIDGGLTWEVSRINVDGDADNSQTFNFLKPILNFTYNMQDNLQLQLRASRTVGQLNFEDFAASNDVTDDRVLAGNPNLSPDQTWRLETSVDWRFNRQGSIVVRLFHEWRNDVLEQIILPSGGFGLGNAGNATFYGLEADLILPLDFAIPGGRFEAGYRRRENSLFDPIIGQNRRLSDINDQFMFFEFRQDLVKQRFAWGIEMDGGFEEPNFFVSETLDFTGPYRFNAYVETVRFFGVKMRLEWNRFTGNEFIRDRAFFEPDRGGTFTGREVQTRDFRSTVRFIVTTPF